jgi:hypothetical protein
MWETTQELIDVYRDLRIGRAMTELPKDAFLPSLL